jgi:mitochondrial fission 1 protein
MTDLPYAADAEISLSYDELEVSPPGYSPTLSLVLF